MVTCPHALASAAGRRRAARRRLGGRRGHRHQRRAVGGLSAHDRRGRRRVLADPRCEAKRACAISTAAAARPRGDARRGFASAGMTRFRSAAFCPRRSRRPARWRAGARRTPRTAGCRSRAISKRRSAMRATDFPVTRAARRAGSRETAERACSRTRTSAAIFLPERQVAARRREARQSRISRARSSAIADDGRAGFYEGEVGDASSRASRSAARRVLHRRAISPRSARIGASRSRGTYRDVTLYETPPPTQGFTVLQMLELLEPFELAQAATSSGPITCTCSCRRSRSRITTAIAGSAIRHSPTCRWTMLLSTRYADERRALIDPARALPWDRCRRTAASAATPCTSPSSTAKATRCR